MNKVYGYIRVSSIAQAMQGQSLEVQEELIRKFFEYKLASTCEWAELIKDPAVSASVNLRDRDGGQTMDRQLEKGDHIVFSKLDRGFRNTIDLLQTVRDWHKRGITVHMLDVGIDLTSEMGQLLMGFLGMFAEWERMRFRQRCMEGRARKKATGKTLTQRYLGSAKAVPWGYKKVKFGKKYRILPDQYTRKMARWFIACYERGWDVKKIWYYTLQHRVHRLTKEGTKGEWSPRTITYAMKMEKVFQEKEALEAARKQGTAVSQGDAAGATPQQSQEVPGPPSAAAEPDPPSVDNMAS
jgi:DNA invertase Pin-like site-specific DNA recombinase